MKLSSSIWLTSVSLLLVLGLTVSSCSRKISFPISEVLPAAEGSFKIKRDKNKNYLIDLEVSNMAPPDRLQPPRSTYVVWVETDEGTKNIGRMNISGKLNGSLETVTPFKPTRLFITAEDDAAITNPGMQVVLRTEKFHVK